MVRCGLELQAHRTSCWATLTYDDAHVPVTLRKDHLSAFVKRLRARLGDRRFRFFGCGEYGDERGRPHYHIILFGLAQGRPLFSMTTRKWSGAGDEDDIIAAWGMGRVQVDRLEPAAIAYVAGYTTKKLDPNDPPQYEYGRYEALDRETGEITSGIHRNTFYQPPFLLMSRQPGIGGDARKFWRSFRDSAMWEGTPVRPPRFLHEAYKANASPSELEALQQERDEFYAQLPVDAGLREQAQKTITLSKLRLASERRRKL